MDTVPVSLTEPAAKNNSSNELKHINYGKIHEFVILRKKQKQKLWLWRMLRNQAVIQKTGK